MIKKILVTGASSFVGQHLIPKLTERIIAVKGSHILNASVATQQFEILTPSSKELNLLDKNNVVRYMQKHHPDTIIHMAARCGGIGANKDAPGEFIHDNLTMAVNLFEGIRVVNYQQTQNGSAPSVKHFYGLGTVCAYPKFCPVPFKEDDLWNGFPEETNAPYGQAKRSLLLLQQAFRDQFGLKGAHLIPVNMYGQYDHFDLRNSHVIPALIRKFVEAKDTGAVKVEVWGDGTPTREFLYAGDCAKAIVRAIVNEFDCREPVNIGTGQDISIKDLAFLIKDIVGFEGALDFTGEVAINGQPQRRLDVSRAKELLGFTAQTSLKEGLVSTIDWYLQNIYTPHGVNVNQEEKTPDVTSDKATQEWHAKIDAISRIIKASKSDDNKEIETALEDLLHSTRRFRRARKYFSLDDTVPEELQKYLQDVSAKYSDLPPEVQDVSVEDLHSAAIANAEECIENSAVIKGKAVYTMLYGLRHSFYQKIDQTKTIEEVRELRRTVLGRDGEMSRILRKLGELRPELRVGIGNKVNTVHAQIDNSLSSRERILRQEASKEAVEQLGETVFADAQKAVKEAFNYNLGPAEEIKNIASLIIKGSDILATPRSVQATEPVPAPQQEPEEIAKPTAQDRSREVFVSGLKRSGFSDADIENRLRNRRGAPLSSVQKEEYPVQVQRFIDTDPFAPFVKKPQEQEKEPARVPGKDPAGSKRTVKTKAEVASEWKAAQDKFESKFNTSLKTQTMKRGANAVCISGGILSDVEIATSVAMFNLKEKQDAEAAAAEKESVKTVEKSKDPLHKLKKLSKKIVLATSLVVKAAKVLVQ